MGRAKAKLLAVSSKTTPSPFFQLLPLELREKIYGYTFPYKSATLNVILKSEWVRREQIRIARHNYAHRVGPKLKPGPFPACPLNEMAVSRQFDNEATPVRLGFSTRDNFNEFVERNRRALFFPSVTSVQIDWCDIREPGSLKFCVGLRALHMTLENDMDLTTKDHGHLVSDNVDGPNQHEKHLAAQLNETEFEDIWWIRDIIKANSLKSVTLLPGVLPTHLNTVQTQQWQSNVAAMNGFITSKLEEKHANERRQHQDAIGSYKRFHLMRGCKRLKLS